MLEKLALKDLQVHLVHQADLASQGQLEQRVSECRFNFALNSEGGIIRIYVFNPVQ